MKSIHIISEGRVQGVGYRMFVLNLARRNQVAGWVRNLPDGRVESVIEGDDERVDAMIEGMYARNSAKIRVDNMILTPRPPEALAGFEIRLVRRFIHSQGE
ncbi:MAG TPA: acylphosphatase [Methanospirillum sp.]|nr:acylphosphatase [Methanospirillum sp.]